MINLKYNKQVRKPRNSTSYLAGVSLMISLGSLEEPDRQTETDLVPDSSLNLKEL